MTRNDKLDAVPPKPKSTGPRIRYQGGKTPNTATPPPPPKPVIK